MIGQTVSHYRITAELGAGGMGVVYQAEDTRLKRPVALKFLPAELTRDPDAKARFIQEARAASALDHPNVCTIHDIGETEDGRLFIAMACYDGETLKERIARGPVPLNEALEITRQIAEGLAKAHAQGIVHRDIKPANIFVTTDGLVKILDFGVAKLRGEAQLTRVGTTLGTAAYMSPEQARGEDVDHRTDIWSLGVVFYEMIAGGPPFGGEHEQAVVYAVLNTEPEPLAGVSPKLQEVMEKSLAKTPADRFQATEDLLSELDRVIKQGMQEGTRGRHPAGRLPRRWAGIAAATLLAAILVVTAYIVLKPESSETTGDVSLAVVDFRDLENPTEVTRSVGLSGLVQVGLVESDMCRIVSPQYLYDLRRRLFGSGRGPIEDDQVLQVARESGATMMLSGQIVGTGPGAQTTWQLVDTDSGESLGARRVQGENLAALADRIIADVVPLLARECGAEEPSAPTPVSGLTTASPEAYEHYLAGKLAKEEGKNEVAVPEFERAVAIDSTFALAYYELSKIYYHILGGASEYRTTRDYVEKAWEHRSHLGIKDRLAVEAWRERVEDRFSEALGIYQEMLSRWPEDKETLLNLVLILNWFWKMEQTDSVARQGMALYPQEFTFVDIFASNLSYLGRAEEAAEAASEFAEQHPDDPHAWVLLAENYLARGLPDSAETMARRALDIEPDLLAARRILPSCDYARGGLQAAIEGWENILSRRDILSGQRIANLTLGWDLPTLPYLYAESGCFQKALALFHEARLAAPDAETELYVECALNRILLRMGMAEQVLNWAQSVPERAESDKTRRYASYDELRALISLDSLSLVPAALDRWQSLNPEGVVFLHAKLQRLADMALAEGDAETALDLLHERRGYGLSPFGGWDTIEYLEALARAYKMAGELEAAAGVHEETLSRFGGHVISHYDLGKIYEEMGRLQAAEQQYIAFLKAWVEADEGLPQPADARARLAALRGQAP